MMLQNLSLDKLFSLNSYLVDNPFPEKLVGAGNVTFQNISGSIPCTHKYIFNMSEISYHIREEYHVYSNYNQRADYGVRIRSNRTRIQQYL